MIRFDDKDDEYYDDDDDLSQSGYDVSQDKAQGSYSPDEREYYDKLPAKRKKTIDALEAKISEASRDDMPMRFKILESDMPLGHKVSALERLDLLSNPYSSDYGKGLAFCKALVRLPFGKYHSLPISSSSSLPDIRAFLTAAASKLDEYIYGLQEVKQRFLSTVAKWILSPGSSGLVLGIKGPTGVGKTTLVKDGLCRALDRPFAFVPLGSANDTSFLDGHSYTYEGSTWGRIADVLMSTQVMNPVICFDELDKVADNSRGNEIYNVLVHLTDATQNDNFSDKYFAGLPLDLSRCIFVFTYNDSAAIHPVLRNRIVEVPLVDYTAKEKLLILVEHMLPKILSEYAPGSGPAAAAAAQDLSYLVSPIQFSRGALEHIVSRRSASNGMRDIKHDVQYLVGTLNLQHLLGNNGSSDAGEVSREVVEKLLKQRDKNDAKSKELPDNVRNIYA